MPQNCLGNGAGVMRQRGGGAVEGTRFLGCDRPTGITPISLIPTPAKQYQGQSLSL
ncbi:hypothetical protein NG799_04225 [Laspinema sp. D1]|uniref:Uncharacterized protein n=1 Tax=Laspinema palackyanum D2a TaxID=2953684 RepID=A0ABT2MLB4_9CYAN|nr:hypothetical protein [Laspinema sp. D2a]